MLDVAQGFNMVPTRTADSSIFTPTGGILTGTDAQSILAGEVGPWVLSMMTNDPLAMEEVPLDSQTVGTLMLEFLTAQAILAFQAKASSVMPKSAMGRVVMVDYTPWKRPDPPIPLLSLLTLDMGAVSVYNKAMHDFLANNNAIGLWTAIGGVLRSGVDVFTRSEAFFFYTKVISLATGAYSQRYETRHT